MNLYLLEQSVVRGYDTYDSCVVCAATTEEARLIRPNRFGFKHGWPEGDDLNQVMVTFIGVASSFVTAGSVVCSSFNAG